MKIFKINYKLQTVPHATKPVQLVCSLNTKWEGKYLYQICQTGISVKKEDWDDYRNLPKKAELAGKLLLAKENAEFAFNKGLSHFNDEEIFNIYSGGYIKQEINEYLQKYVHNTITPKADFLNKNFRWQELQREEIYVEILNKIKSAKYLLVDVDGNKINLDLFFNLEVESDPEQLIQTAFQPVPIIQVPNSNSTSTNGSCLMHDDDVNKYGSMTYSDFVDFVKNRKIKSGDLADGKSYGVLMHAFDEFDSDITVNELTDEVFLNFFDFLQEERDLELPSFNNYKKWVKAVFNFSISQLTMQFNSKKLNVKSDIFNRSSETVSRPYLTEEMLDKILNFKFESENKHLEYIRDLFYVQCYTSVTYVDLPQLFKNVKVKTVDGNQIKCSSIRRKKTGVEADIMLFEQVYSILEKYGFKFNKISNAYYNRTIKDMLELVGFTDEFVQERFNTKTKATTYKTAPFFSFIGSHTGRRSYITNMKKRGIQDELIMNQSQHTSKKAFDMYVQDSKTVNFENFVREIKVNKM